MIYPVLKKEQYAVSVAYSSTGKVLNVQGEIPKSENEAIFHVFNSLEDVYSFIKRRVGEDNSLEFSIFDSTFEVIKYVQNEEAIRIGML
jgi:hypothetical protein